MPKNKCFFNLWSHSNSLNSSNSSSVIIVTTVLLPFNTLDQKHNIFLANYGSIVT